MASTASTYAKVELQGAGDNPGTWHTALNDALTFHEQDYRGTVALTAGGANITLTDTQYVTNQARQLFINITGTASTAISIIAPDRSQFYVVDMLANPDGNVVTFKPLSGVGFTLERFHQYIVRMDGSGVASVIAQSPEEVVTLAGTSTYTGSFSQLPVSTSYDGFVANVTFSSANTGASTANFNSLGAVAIKKDGTDALVANDISAGMKGILVCDGTNYQIITSKIPAGSPEYYTITPEKTANFTAVAGDLVPCDTSGSSWTLTLPASPTLGDRVKIIKYGSGVLTIGRNSTDMRTLTENGTINTGDQGVVEFIMTDATNGWDWG